MKIFLCLLILTATACGGSQTKPSTTAQIDPPLIEFAKTYRSKSHDQVAINRGLREDLINVLKIGYLRDIPVKLEGVKGYHKHFSYNDGSVHIDFIAKYDKPLPDKNTFVLTGNFNRLLNEEELSEYTSHPVYSVKVEQYGMTGISLGVILCEATELK